jgi:predicted acetyltransferase
MKVQSDAPLEKFQYDFYNTHVRIHWNEELITIPGQFEGQTTQVYQYDEALVKCGLSRSDMIEKIIACEYSIAKEIATINNKDTKPERYAIYQAYRQMAKQLTDEYLATL